MNENHDKICRTCLRTDENVHAMNYDDLINYESLIAKLPLSCRVFICVYCRQILKKFMKFIHQCTKANDFLNKNNGKIHLHQSLPTLEYSYRLQKSLVSTNTLGLDECLDKQVISNFEHNETDLFLDEFDPNSDDDLPLAALSKTNNENEVQKRNEKHKKARKKASQKKNYQSEKVDITKSIGLKRRKWVTAKGAEKEGFSSKMVQETEEYWVVKLTKEEVLQEMEERSKSDKYLKYAYKCEKCVKGFNFDDVLQNHMQRHSPKIGSFECDICHQFCPSAVSMRGHMKSHTTRYKCKVCVRVRRSRQQLLEHHAAAHGGAGACRYTCSTCLYSTDKRTVIQRHVRSHKSERHTCHQCGKSFSTIMALRVHLQRHDSSARCVCSECGRRFLSQRALQRHVSSVHERRDFYCVECDVRFQCQYNLNLHFKRARKHRNDVNNNKRTVIQRHVRSHKSERHTCHQCGKSFSTIMALMRVHLQ